MKTVKIKCSSCGNEVSAVQYEKCKKIQVFCSDCEKGFTVNLRKGCGIPIVNKEGGEMKDKRLDILLERLPLAFLTGCRYLSKDLGEKFCIKTMKDGDFKRVNCKGNIKKCELEE